jgi:hypothetical protein
MIILWIYKEKRYGIEKMHILYMIFTELHEYL